MKNLETRIGSSPSRLRCQYGRLGNVLAFVAAVVIFFLIGFYFIGPWLQGTAGSHNQPSAGHPVAERSDRPAPTESRHAPTISVEINEKTSPSRTPIAPQPAAPPQPRIASTQTPPPRQQHPEETQSLQPPTVPEAEPATSRKLYRVQAGLFQDRANAEALSTKLVQSGYSARIVSITADSGEMYSVQVGAFADRANADKLATEVRNSGFQATVSSPE